MTIKKLSTLPGLREYRDELRDGDMIHMSLSGTPGYPGFSEEGWASVRTRWEDFRTNIVTDESGLVDNYPDMAPSQRSVKEYVDETMLRGNLTVSFSPTMNTSTIQGFINEVPKNLGGHTVVFQFEDGEYNNLGGAINIQNFSNGAVMVQGDITGGGVDPEPGPETLHTNQNVELNFSSSTGIYFGNCPLVYVKNLKITIPDISDKYCMVFRNAPCYIQGCYLLMNTSANTNTVGVFAIGCDTYIEKTYFKNVYYGIIQDYGCCCVKNCAGVVNQLPDIGLTARYGGIIGHIGLPIEGSLQNYSERDGGIVQFLKDEDGTLGANSDDRVPSQKAVKTYVDSGALNDSITVLFEIGDTAGEIQRKIDAVPYNLNGHTVHFQFEYDPAQTITYTLSSDIQFRYFHGGYTYIQGDSSEGLDGGTGYYYPYENQKVFLDFPDETHGFVVRGMNNVKVRNLKIRVANSVDHYPHCVHLTDSEASFTGNYFLATGRSQTYGIVAYNGAASIYTTSFGKLHTGIYMETSNANVRGCVSVGTGSALPEYGMYASRGGIIGYGYYGDTSPGYPTAENPDNNFHEYGGVVQFTKDNGPLGDSTHNIPTEYSVKTYVDAQDGQNVKITGDQTITGKKTFTTDTYHTARLFVPSGTVGAPSIAWSADGATNTGFYHVGENDIGIAVAGQVAGRFKHTGSDKAQLIMNNGMVSRPSYAFAQDADSGMYSPADTQIGFAINGVKRAWLSYNDFFVAGRIYGNANGQAPTQNHEMANKKYVDDNISTGDSVHAAVNATATGKGHVKMRLANNILYITNDGTDA